MVDIIPKPQVIEEKEGKYFFKNQFITFYAKDKQIEELCWNFTDDLLTKFGIESSVGTKKNNSNFAIELDAKIKTESKYILDINAETISLKARNKIGIFYGFQTFMQLMQMEAEQYFLPQIHIEDWAQYGWRGMHLDVSRHFFPVYFIKKYLDLMAFYKLNKFHWHLTDDNGWRLEIKKYPELTKISAWRKNLEHLQWNSRANAVDRGNGSYGGFYTQEEVREIIEYAAERGIEIIPEIEMPGHTSEVFAAFPHLNCKGVKTEVAPGGYWPNLELFCAGKDESFEFLENILQEVIDLFPSKYVHIGGDEANKTRWQECPLCQKRIKDENLNDENELQSYFIHRIQNFIESKGKKIIGWDEIIDGGISSDATVMCWRGDGKDAADIATKNGSEVIMCPNSILYFDWRQTEKADEQGAFGVTTLEKVYQYSIDDYELSEEQKKLVLGMQGNVWTEFMPMIKDVEYMTIPRICALAENAWNSKKDFADFKHRLKQHKEFLKENKYNLCEEE